MKLVLSDVLKYSTRWCGFNSGYMNKEAKEAKVSLLIQVRKKNCKRNGGML